jgi:UDP:flavonoid glycosyltransferase YjiC (YdhE family)
MLAALNNSTACILSPLAQFGGYDACEKLGIYPVITHLQPVVPMDEYPSPFFPDLPNIVGRGIYNRFTANVVIVALWQMFRPLVNAARVERLGLEKHSLSGTWGATKKRKVPILMAYSPHIIVPPEKNWPENYHTTGYWFLDEPLDWSPPVDLEAFLSAGEPPIYIGFGSMASRNPEKNTQIMLEALVQSGERGLLLTGWGGLQDTALPDNVFKIQSCPHSWLFPRVKAIVHHGGAGTTAAAFRAGKPQVVVPFFADQPFWGKITQKLGVGVKPLPNKTVSSESLASAIRQVSSNAKMQQTAKELGEKIAAESGVANAVKVIKQILAG